MSQRVNYLVGEKTLLDYFRQGQSMLAFGSHRTFLAGSVLVSLGILLAAGGGSWDITNHLLNKPETFFAPPHGILYSGVGSAVAGIFLLLRAPRVAGKLVWPAKLAIAGVALLVSAGPIDFAWHSTYGLDGLFSPPHFVLVIGMVTSSLGGLLSIVYYKTAYLRTGERVRLHPVLVVLGILPVWLSLSGVVDLFTLPFSKTQYFNFNPDPASAVVIATASFPLVIAACLCASSALSGRRFGVMSLTGAAFIVTGVLTSIFPSDSLHPTIPFYILSIIPIIAADAIMSYRFWRPFAISVYVSGAILGLLFLALYYPLITHTFNKDIDNPRIVWASVTGPIYFEMMPMIYPVAAIPSAGFGIAGAIVASRLATAKIL